MNVRRIAAITALAAATGVFGTAPARADLGTIRREAEHGNAQAELRLGILYEFGYHLADHDVKAAVWYTLAAERGSKDAARRRDLLTTRLSSAERKAVAQEVATFDARTPPAPVPATPGPSPSKAKGGTDSIPSAESAPPASAHPSP
ncbi:MAG: hypothetical protein ACYDB8_11565 [Acidiferrobacterales bacterium]